MKKRRRPKSVSQQEQAGKWPQNQNSWEQLGNLVLWVLNFLIAVITLISLYHGNAQKVEIRIEVPKIGEFLNRYNYLHEIIDIGQEGRVSNFSKNLLSKLSH
jgi:hypothetical protein